VSSIARGQIIVTFSPTIYGQSLDGLVYAQIINTSGMGLRVIETISIRDVSGGNVVSIKTAPFILSQGTNFISKAAFTNGKFSFSNSYSGNFLSQTGKLPEGEFEYCFQTEIIGDKPDQVPPFYENCFILQLQPMTPLLLIDPVDEDKICNKRPNLLWQLPAPLPVDAKCRVVLTEKKEKQDIAEAIAFNLPVLNQGNIFGNILQYPPGAPDLKEGHTYAWQVTVYSAKTILKKSEIWTFTVSCQEEQKLPAGDSYRELKEIDDGNFYIANKVLRFSFNNPYSKGKLDYSIESLSKPQSTIKRLPSLKMEPGLNKYELDFSENNSLKAGQEYLLTVRLANNRELRLRFIYQTE
jgi:hypothetical protein